MLARFASTKQLLLSTGVLVALAGCAATPMGPTVQVMPGPGKSFDAFRADTNECKGYAYSQVQGQAEASNQRAAGTALVGAALGAGIGALAGGAYGNAAGAGAAFGAGAGLAGGSAIAANNQAYDQAAIQQQYDNAFASCMVGKGNQVPGYSAGPTPSFPVAQADPLVRATQVELNRLGYGVGGADGVMGPATRAGISRFEASQGLPVDGAPSGALLARLQATPAGGGGAGAGTPTGGGTPVQPTQAQAPSNWVAPTTH